MTLPISSGPRGIRPYSMSRNPSAAFAFATGSPVSILNNSTPTSASPQRKTPSCNVRDGMRTARLAAISTATAAVVAWCTTTPGLAAISAPECLSGEGPGCEAAAAESPIIKELLEKSKANREKNEKKLLEDYWTRGYGDYFSFGSNKDLVKGEDGKWSLQEPNDLRTRIEKRIAEAIRNQLSK